MHCDVLIAEIGSTTTLVNAFDALDSSPAFLGQGQAATSVLGGDVRVGLNAAVDDLKRKLNTPELCWSRMLASSSAAGGLRMCVHGLVYDMTVRAAEAAALGAGAVIRQTTAGRITNQDMAEQRRIRPNLVLLAGGTDYGERDTALYNARVLAQEGTGAPVLYAGNIQNRTAIERIFSEADIRLYTAENVYPKLDALNIEPTRRCIHEAFERHIVEAPGMTHIRDMVDGAILPTPGAVMEAAMLLYGSLGDLMVIDIGGATTDVHSVTEGSEELMQFAVGPEPFNKRTVEGDLGLYVNAHHLVDMLDAAALSRELGIDVPAVLKEYRPIPDTPQQLLLTERLCLEAGRIALRRHAGKLRYIYMPEGRKTVAEGKDCTRVRLVVATGGALTRLEHHERLLREITDLNVNGAMLFPKPNETRLAFDRDYTMASLGVLSRENPSAALTLMKRSLVCDTHL